MYRMRMQLNVVVDIECEDKDEAFVKLAAVKRQLRETKLSDGKIRDAVTDMILKEESYPG